jgi:hypothetical protein
MLGVGFPLVSAIPKRFKEDVSRFRTRDLWHSKTSCDALRFTLAGEESYNEGKCDSLRAYRSACLLPSDASLPLDPCPLQIE